MSLLKVSLCINRPKQRLLCMDTRRWCRSKRSPTPWKNKIIFFAVWRPFCYVFLLAWGLFHNVGAFFAIIFFMWGDFFVFMWDLCLYGLAPSPYNLFCGHMLLCNFHPMFSAIMYPTKPTATPVFNLQ